MSSNTVSPVVGWGRGILGLFILPFAPFFSAILWKERKGEILATTILTLAGYLVFFVIAMGWGVSLVLTAMAVSLVGGIFACRRRRRS
jgi:hypothetical protein